MEHVDPIELFLSLQLFFFVIRLSVFGHWHWHNECPYPSTETRMQSATPSMITLQKDDSQVLEKDIARL